MKIVGHLSKREAQVMDLAYAQGRVTAAELEKALPGNPSNSAVRTHLRTLETKGHLVHTEEEGRFVYRPTNPREAVARGELRRLLDAFFGGSVTAVVSTLLEEEKERLTPWELDEIRRMVDEALEGRR